MDFIRQRSQLIQRMVDFRKKQHWNSLQQKRYLLFPVSVKNEFGSCSKRNAGQITTNLSSVLCQNKFGSCSKRNAGQITTNLSSVLCSKWNAGQIATNFSSVLWLRPLAVVQNGMLDKLQRISPPSSGYVLWQLFVLWLRPLGKTLGYKGASRGFNPVLGALDFISARFLITNRSTVG
jgi:hypothetical protein